MDAAVTMHTIDCTYNDLTSTSHYFLSYPLPYVPLTLHIISSPYPAYLYNSIAHNFAVISLTITDPHSFLHSHTNTLPFSLSPPITLTPPHSPSPSHSLTHTAFFLDCLLTPMSFPGSPSPIRLHTPSLLHPSLTPTPHP